MAKATYSKMEVFIGDEKIGEITSYEGIKCDIDVKPKNVFQKVFAKAMFYISRFKN